MISTRTIHRGNRLRRRARRTGATTVEFALVAATLFMVLFGAIEFARLNQINNGAAMAAYAGCRSAIIPGGTSATATTAAQALLTAGQINGATITINPSTITNSTTTITVTVAVSMDSNGWTPGTYTKGKTVTRSCTLTREKTN